MTRYALTLLGILMVPPTPVWAAEGAAGPDIPPGSEGKAQAQAKDDVGAKSAAGVKAQGAVVPSSQPVVNALDAKAATDAATAYLNALKGQGFAAAPAHLHPEAMVRFKALVMPGLKDEQARGNRNLLNATFGRDAPYTSAVSADPADFLNRFARLISAREPDAVPRFSGLVPVGVVREGEQLHVLMRLTQSGSGPEAVERIEVVSLLPQGKDWKIALDGRLAALASNLGSRARGGPPRMEPMPEGLPPPPLPGEPQGPAGTPPLPR